MLALIFGRAKGVWEELEQAKALGDFSVVIGVGGAAVDYPGVLHHWVSFHTDLFAHWVTKREGKGYPPAGEFWSCNYRNRPARVKTPVPVSLVDCNGGSSGFIALKVALEKLDAHRVVLAGIPMTHEGGQYDTADQWTEAHKYRREWLEHLDMIKGRVRSMSGWTQEQFGTPTREWLAEE